MIATYYLPRVGGGEDTIKNYCRIFKKKGHYVEVITKKYDMSLKDTEIIEGVKIHRVPYHRSNKLGLVKFWRWMWKNRAKFKDFDVVMYNDFSTFYWYLPLKFYFKKPDVILYYGYEGFPIKIKHKILRRIAKEFTKKSINGGRYLDKYYGFKTDDYIYEGVGDIEKVPVSKKKNKAVFIGGLRKDTSILEYLKFLKILKQNHGINLGLDVYGGGDLDKLAKTYAKNNKLNVIFHGVVPNAKRFIPMYKYGFATQWGSIMDCMRSRTLIFALCKLPITLDYDREILDEGRYGIISTDPGEMVDKFIKCYKNEKLFKDITAQAYDHSKTRTWNKIAGKILTILEQAIKS